MAKKAKSPSKPRTTVLAAVEMGSVEEVMVIMSRLQDLREFGMYDHVRRVSELQAKVADAEAALAHARNAFRNTAEGVIRRVLETWTAEEIQEATGY